MYLKKPNKSYTLQDIANYCECEIIGNSETIIEGLCSLDNPLKNHIAFSKKKLFSSINKEVKGFELGAVFILNNIEINEDPNSNYLLTKDPQLALIKSCELFFQKIQSKNTVSPNCHISKSAKIGKNVEIADNVSILDNVTIGDNVIIFPNTTIYPYSSIGDNTIIHSNCVIREYSQIGKNVLLQSGVVIGADGFGYIQTVSGLSQVPQIGNVILEDFVEVGANSCIDRATLGSTIIGFGTKIDNLVQVGHNTKVGKFSILCGQVGIAGSTTIGNGVVLGGAVKVKDHLTIVDGCKVAGGSFVFQSLDIKDDYAGNPAMPAKKWMKIMLSQKK